MVTTIYSLLQNEIGIFQLNTKRISAFAATQSVQSKEKFSHF